MPSLWNTIARCICGLTLGGTLAGSVTACGDMAADLPAGSVDPKTYATPEAALQMAGGARYEYQVALLEFMLDAGRISDEFFDPDSATRLPGFYNVVNSNGTLSGPTSVVVLDQRHLPDETLQQTTVGNHVSTVTSYPALQRARTIASLARRAVEANVPEPRPVLRAELFAYEALAEVMLADLYCSGIPLSTLDFGADWTYRPGSSTVQVYEHAVTLLDSAIALAVADPAILSRARVAQGRALLALGRFTEAAAAVRDVSTDFRSEMLLMNANPSSKSTADPSGINWSARATRRGSIADRKGINGLPFGTTSDPRIWRATATSPARPVVPQRTHLLVASGIEARLIEAEADLRAGGSQWLAILNTLRTNGTVLRTYTRTNQRGIHIVVSGVTTVTQVGSPGPAGVIDTTWGPGTGIGMIPAATLADIGPVCPTALAPGVVCTDTVWYKGLRALTDPGTEAARVDLLFQERAFWLFFTGNRQGDLRRLLRHYDRTVATTYPMGPSRGGLEMYDDYVDVPIPASERFNPYITGCISRGE